MNNDIAQVMEAVADMNKTMAIVAKNAAYSADAARATRFRLVDLNKAVNDCHRVILHVLQEQHRAASK